MTNPMVNYHDEVQKENDNTFAVRDEYKSLTVEELKQIQNSERYPFAICLLNVTGSLNTGTIIRTACAMGASKVILFGRKWYDKRSAICSYQYVDVERIEGLLEDGLTIDNQKFWNFLEENSYIPVFCETGGQSLNEFDWLSLIANRNWNMSDYDYTLKYKPLLIFGTERTGIPEELMKNEIRVSIPMNGVLRSMNVSTAAAMFMYDLKIKMGWMK